MNPSSAYFLVIHGSRDLKVLLAASQLKQLISSKISTNNIITRQNHLDFSLASSKTTTVSRFGLIATPLVEIAPLELGTLPLHTKLVEFAGQAACQGFEQVKVVPLFLAPGIHVTEDIPVEIALAIKQINNQVTIELSPYLGKYSGMVSLLEEKFTQLSRGGRILVAHGSRLPSAKNLTQALAKQLGAVVAYWSTEPSLSQQVANQVSAGQQTIAILPYFLFSGKITKAIAQQVTALQKEYPAVELVVGNPLGATESLAELIVKEL